MNRGRFYAKLARCVHDLVSPPCSWGLKWTQHAHAHDDGVRELCVVYVVSDEQNTSYFKLSCEGSFELLA